ncbi:MAG: DNA/RNA non-specific endonuclease [Hydrococcus sp. RM1_1_31]|nr:DNA/RNA non-specific endonuclease [Hydrococcus sp. RM1_1_31]
MRFRRCFNGNFDASFDPSSKFRTSVPIFGSTAIPGWSYHSGGGKNSKALVDWKNIDSLKDYRDLVGYDSNKPNYALRLEGYGGNGNDSIVHNRFVVPDWGVLRFDLHVDNPDNASDPQNSVVRVYLNGQELQSSAFQGLVKGSQGGDFPAVDLREVDSDIGARNGEGQSNRIGFAEQGFQTFQVDIPNEFRGKIATLKFELSGGKTVYLDNVFFKSQHLLFGNPALNGKEARKDIDTPTFYPGYDPFLDTQTNPPSNFFDNYLLEKPQYSVSYNDNVKTANWVSYQLNKSWLGVQGRLDNFGADPRLPFSDQTTGSDIKDDSKYEKGHLATFSHRNRNRQDVASTFLMTNIIPQPLKKPNGDRWTKLEEYLTYIVENQNKELYIIAGRDGYTSKVISSKRIIVPESVWKVVLVLDKPGMGINDVTKDTLAFGIYLPNTLDAMVMDKTPIMIGQQILLFSLMEKSMGYLMSNNLKV